jgi:hypothetical protein
MIVMLYSITSISPDSGAQPQPASFWERKEQTTCDIQHHPNSVARNRFDRLKLCTNILPEEGIMQPYLDEGSGAVHDAGHAQAQLAV